MHVISRKKLKEAAAQHEDRAIPLDAWVRVAERASWMSLTDVRRTFATADAVGNKTVFNIKGNKYRLIVEINYTFGRIYVREVLTHAAYDRGAWKR